MNSLKTQVEVKRVLDLAADRTLTDIEATAYNHLVDYLDPGFAPSWEAENLLSLCLMIVEKSAP